MRVQAKAGRKLRPAATSGRPAHDDAAQGRGHATSSMEEIASHAGIEKPRGLDGSTALSLYMREVGTVDLLTPKEEVRLAAAFKRGNAAARERMIRANLRLVVKIARQYDGLGLPLLDLISEGNIGLMSAVERFDPSKGAKLSTYGAWWIKQSIRRALANQAKTIRLPVHIVDRIYHIRRASLKFLELYGRDPSNAEIAAELGGTATQITEILASSIRPASLDAPIGEDESNRLADIVRDENAPTPYQHLEEKTVRETLAAMVARLPKREAAILRHRFGLDGETERTLEEVGAEFGVTRERVRQLQNLALRKLRRMISSLDPALPAA
jgi:RNA polymerase primary sigma factor